MLDEQIMDTSRNLITQPDDELSCDKQIVKKDALKKNKQLEKTDKKKVQKNQRVKNAFANAVIRIQKMHNVIHDFTPKTKKNQNSAKKSIKTNGLVEKF